MTRVSILYGVSATCEYPTRTSPNLNLSGCPPYKIGSEDSRAASAIKIFVAGLEAFGTLKTPKAAYTENMELN
jgi:hypothetical protein